MGQFIWTLVRDTIYLDNKLFRSAHKVSNVRPDGFLSGELEVIQLAVAQVLPKFGFGWGGFAAQGSGAR